MMADAQADFAAYAAAPNAFADMDEYKDLISPEGLDRYNETMAI
jgi:hypothetical protein